MMHWGSDFGMGFGWFFMIVFWGLIILGIYYFIKLVAGQPSTKTSGHESAEELLRKRFAKGEISREEFEETLEMLQKTRHTQLSNDHQK